jgi:hypothetical protein
VPLCPAMARFARGDSLQVGQSGLGCREEWRSRVRARTRTWPRPTARQPSGASGASGQGSRPRICSAVSTLVLRWGSSVAPGLWPAPRGRRRAGKGGRIRFSTVSRPSGRSGAAVLRPVDHALVLRLWWRAAGETCSVGVTSGVVPNLDQAEVPGWAGWSRRPPPERREVRRSLVLDDGEQATCRRTGPRPLQTPPRPRAASTGSVPTSELDRGGHLRPDPLRARRGGLDQPGVGPRPERKNAASATLLAHGL